MDRDELTDFARKLAYVQQQRLPELLQAHANESRNAELPNFRDFRTPATTIDEQAVCRALKQLTGLEHAKTVGIVQSALRPTHPRTELALDLIVQFLPTIEPMVMGWGQDGAECRSRVATPEEGAEWNPVTGGPAVEKWEAEQREIALAKARSTEQSARTW